MTSKGQLFAFPLLLLATSAFAVDSSFYQSMGSAANQDLINDALTRLVLGPLRGHDILLVSDMISGDLIDANKAMEAAESSLTPVILTTQESLIHKNLPLQYTKGSLLTAFFIFYDDPRTFLLRLADNKNWNPGYLILFCLNPQLNISSVLGHSVVQRSQFILLLTPDFQVDRSLRLQGNHPRLQSSLQVDDAYIHINSLLHLQPPPHLLSPLRLKAYTSLPHQLSPQGRPLTAAPLGVWNSDKFHNRQSAFPSRYLNFGGQLLNVPVVCYDEPFLYLDMNDTCIGGNSDALKIIGKKLNFSYMLYEPVTLFFGNRINGTWNGMLGELARGRDLLTMNVLQPKLDRIEDFDFTYPYWDTSFGIILRVPPPVPRWKNVLYPFSSLVWLLIIATTITSASVLALLLKFLYALTDPLDLILKVVSGLFGQAMNDQKVRHLRWARVWLIFWWLSVDILAAAYISNLMSVLTLPVHPYRVQTVQELAQSKLVPCMLDYKSFVPQALKSSDNPVLAALGDRMILDPNLIRSDPYGFLLQKVMAGTHALIVTIDYLSFMQHRKKLTRATYIMEDELYKGYLVWWLPKNTPYTTTLSDHLIRLLETGILAKIYRDHTGGLTVKETRAQGDGVLNLEHLQGAFIMLVLGLLAAAMVFLLELTL